MIIDTFFVASIYAYANHFPTELDLQARF